METWWKGILDSMVMGILVPGLMLSIGIKWNNRNPDPEIVQPPAEETVQESVPQKIILLAKNGKTEEMEMEEYVTSVLLGEVPGSFEMEALKAQAVVARTVACRAMCTGGKHGQGAVCTESSCCQAFIPAEEYLRQGGSEQTLEKMTDAAHQTAGQILTYDELPIESTYFSCIWGRSEDAVAVLVTEFS